jgi:hypothetical protein
MGVRAVVALGLDAHFSDRHVLAHRAAHRGVGGAGGRARIAVRCYGRRCPRLAVSAGYKRLGGALRSLAGRVLGAGDLLEITVTSPGLLPERIGVRIRNGEAPRARLL